MLNHNEIRAKMLKIIATESDDTAWTISNKHLMSLVKIYVEEEREMCADLCDKLMDADDSFYAEFSRAEDCARAIRARGNE